MRVTPSGRRLPFRRVAQTDVSAPQPWDLLLVCTAGYILTAVARVHAIVPLLAVARPALLFAVVGFLAYVFGGQRGPRALRELKHPLGYLALFVIAWATFGVPVALLPSRALGFLIEELYKVGVLFLLCAVAVRNLHDVRRLLMVYVIGAGIFAFFATAPGFRSVGGGGYDANDSAMFLTSALPLGVYFLIAAKRLVQRLGYAAVLLTCLLAIVQTGSRGGFLALLAVTGYILFFFKGFKPRWRFGAVAGVVGVVLIAGTAEFWERMQTLSSPEEDYNMQTITGRKQVWTRGVGYMMQNPILGVGIHNFAIAEARHPVIAERIAYGRGTRYRPAHSMWVDVAAELGIPGLLAFVGLFVIAYRRLRRPSASRAPPGAAPADDGLLMGQAVAGSIVALMVAGTFLSQGYGYAVWSMLGLSLGLIKVVSFRRGVVPARSRRGAYPTRAPGLRGAVAAHRSSAG